MEKKLEKNMKFLNLPNISIRNSRLNCKTPNRKLSDRSIRSDLSSLNKSDVEGNNSIIPFISLKGIAGNVNKKDEIHILYRPKVVKVSDRSKYIVYQRLTSSNTPILPQISSKKIKQLLVI